MKKISIQILLLLIILFSFLPSSLSIEDNNDDDNESENFQDPFKNFDFTNVLKLNDTTYADLLKKNITMYILFYAPWCEHCQKYMPTYIEIANYATEKKLDIKFTAVDANDNFTNSELYDIQNFPTIYLVHKGKRIIYRGERDRDSLLSFVERKNNNDIFKFTTLKEIDDFLKNKKLSLLSTLKDKSSSIYKSFEKFSHESFTFYFFSCINDECIKKYGEDIILFKPFDEKMNKYSKDYEDLNKGYNDSVKNFSGVFGIETGVVLNGSDINMMFEYNKNALFYFRNSSIEQQTKYDKLMKELGKEFRKDNIYTFVLDPDGDNMLHIEISHTFGISDFELPCYLFYEVKQISDDQSIQFYSKRSLKENQLTKEYIRQFIKDIKQKKIKNDLFSQAVKDEYPDGIKYVIGKTYDKDVIEEPNNVLIGLIDGNGECELCDDVFEIFRNLSIKYQGDKSKKLIIACMDITANEARDLDLQNNQPPYIYLYTNAMPQKKVISYEPKDFENITMTQVENFLSKNLEWDKKKDENKSDL